MSITFLLNDTPTTEIYTLSLHDALPIFIPAHINELSPDPVRGFLPGFAYQCGVALAGAIGWLEARFAEHLDYAWAMALTAATVFILGTIVAQLGPERRGVAFGLRVGTSNGPR